MVKKHITNKISDCFHKFATTQFPSIIQNIINTGYVKLLGLDMSEFNEPNSYKTLNALFTRALNTPRNIDHSLDNFISPADSFVSEAGQIKGETALQIKGMEYCVKELLTSKISDENFSKIVNGNFMNMYLSPKDYHRYHASYNCQVTKLIHVPGKLYPVNFRYLNKQNSLFVENERVIMECITDEGKLFYMVFVGALNVGKMVFEFEPKVETNSDARDIKVYDYEDLHISKGDCLGYFKMGSTVLMFWEKDMVEIENLVNQKVSFGDNIANLK
ncbi:MAG: phosphatidylserine decarboxylase [Arcobacteraceae bacterium]|nr:phosphatidylserine decarboxylase [Arcobacteraceae bacterium]